MKVLDYSFARPSVDTIKNNGFGAVMRYLSPNSGKNLTAGERDQLRSGGLGIGLVWEWYAERANEGYDAGVADAHNALNQANALGFPSNLPIYFAVDWDASEAQQAAINDYFKGVASVIGLDRTGVYGGYYIVKRLFEAGLVSYGWQTYAWSGGQWYDKAQLRQTLNGQWGGSVDYDESTTDNFGIWVADVPIVDHPTPAPAPIVDQSHKYTIADGDTFWGLEAHNGWTHGVLQALNPGVNPSTLRIGSQINVPGAGGAAPAPSTGHYTIKAGDTFSGLDERNGWAPGTTQGLNPGQNPRTLQIGQVINVPGGGSPAPAVPSTGTYRIEDGDTFWALEHDRGWATGTLQSLNPGVEPTQLQIGEVIRIPA